MLLKDRTQIEDFGPVSEEAYALLEWPYASLEVQDALQPLCALPTDHAIVISLRVGRDRGVGCTVERLRYYSGAPDHAVTPPILPQLFAIMLPGARLRRSLPGAAAQPQLGRQLVPMLEHLGSAQSLAMPRSSIKEATISRSGAAWSWSIPAALAILAEAGGGEIQIAVRHVRRDGLVLRKLAGARANLNAAAHVYGLTPAIQAGLAAVHAMEKDPGLFEFDVRVGSPSLCPELVQLLSLAIFGVRAEEGTLVPGDLRLMAGSCHGPTRLVPIAREIDLVVTAQTLAAETARGEFNLAIAANQAPIGLTESDRTRHLYAIGATGTGKSTLLRSLIMQDIARGEGIILIDPHGDLAQDVAYAIPPEREVDLVFADAADPYGSFGLCLLPSESSQETAERAVDALIDIFKETLYASVPDAFGPVFEQYFRNAVFLLMAAPADMRILANIPRIFEDEKFRNSLLNRCDDQAVISFWRNTVANVSGDSSLANHTPYVTGKLTRLVGTAVARRIFPAAGEGIDFAQAMNAGKILILRCPKGLLGESLASLAISVAVSQIRAAATARASLPPAARKASRIYIDEFQCCRGDSLQGLLAEGRKFGISLTLANQSLGQIGGSTNQSIGAAVLANVGSILVFRVGAPDAMALAPWLESVSDWRTLCRQADFRMAGRILQQGRPNCFSDLKTWRG